MKTPFFLKALIFLFLGTIPTNASLIGMSSQTNAIYEISPETGLATRICQLQEDFAGIGLSYIGGRLFATDNLVHIGEPWDVRLSEIGLETNSIQNLNNQGGSLNWHGLASNQTEGVLYSIDINDRNILKEIALSGEIKSIGMGTGIDGRGMDYDDTHSILYATDMSGGLFSVDISTGVSVFIGPMGIDAELIGLAYDESQGVLFANTTIGASRGGYTSSLYSLNTATGLASYIGSNDAPRIDGLAWNGPLPSVPEPSTLAMVLIGAMALGISIKWNQRKDNRT
jgi:hypothetical protein